MTHAFPTIGKDPLKLQDWSLAQAIGRSVESVRLYRTGRQPIPQEVRARVLQWRAERAIQQIAEAQAELDRIEQEAARHGLTLAANFTRLLLGWRRVLSLGAGCCPERGDVEASTDHASEASQ